MIFNILTLIGLSIFFYILGYGITYFTQKRSSFNSFIWAISPIVGFALLSFFIFVISANFKLNTIISINISIIILLSFTIYSLLFNTIEKLKLHFRNLITLITYIIPIILLALWAVVYQGFDNYYGTVNFDFFQSLAYVQVLSEQNIHVFTLQEPIINSISQVPYPSALQARFGASVIAVMLNSLLSFEYKEALMVTVGFSTIVYYLAGIIFIDQTFKFNKIQTLLTSLLTAASAPLIMSYFHIFVGQNTSIGIFVLLLVLSWKYFQNTDLGTLFLAALLFNSLIWIYSPLITYAMSIIGILMMIYAIKNKNILIFIFPTVIVVLSVVFFRINVLAESMQFIIDFIDLIGRMAQSHYYLDFLTEDFFAYLFGTSPYTFGQSLLSSVISNHVGTFIKTIISILTLVSYVISVLYFFKTNFIEKDSKIFIIVILSFVFLSYIQLSFITMYGYGLFKLIVWFQFIIMPFLVYGLIKLPNSKINKFFVKPILLLSIILSIFNGIDYGTKVFQVLPTKYNKIINGYGIANNQEFTDIENIFSDIPKNSKIGIIFPGSIENFYFSYKLRNFDISIISHELLPDEDAFLPDVKSGKVYDSFGLQHYYSGNPYFREKNDYYLISSKKFNFDIIKNPINGNPLIKTETYSLYSNKTSNEIFYLGRGFYRPENSSNLPWYWPDNTRWSSEGGEFILLNGIPGKSYSLSTFVFVGWGNPSVERTLILYHNGEKIDEVTVNGSSRVNFKEFYSTGNLDKLVIVSKEIVDVSKRDYGIYNTSLPVETRKLNILFGDVELLSDKRIVKSQQLNFTIKDFLKYTKLFNGINPDGWIGNKFNAQINLSKKVSKINIELHVPGNLNFTLPYNVKITLNGSIYNLILHNFGDNSIEINYPESDIIDLLIEPSEVNIISNKKRNEIKSLLIKNIIFN